MGLQFQSTTCQCLKAASREVRNAELTQEVRLRDGMPDIGRVLTSWGQVVLRSKEWQGNLVTVTGGIMVWILYAPEDGTPPRCIDAWVPFQLKWELEESGGEGPIRVYPLLRFVDSRGIAARKLMVRAGVAAMGEMLSPVETHIFYPEDLPPDIQVLKNTYPIRLLKEAAEKTFLLDEDIQMPAGSAPLERLLAYTILPQIQEKRVADDKIIFRGSGKLRVIYRCEEGKVHAVDLEMPFSQFAQLEQSYGTDAQVDTMLGVTSLELLENEGSQLRIKCGLVAQYLVTDRYLVEVIEDAYSPRRSVELNMEELELPSVLECRTEMLQLQQMIPGLDGEMVDAVLLPDFPRQSRSEDRVKLDIPGQFQLLYYGQDGCLQGCNARWEREMQMMADDESKLSFLPQTYGMVQMVKGSDDTMLNGQLMMEMQVQKQTAIPMVTDLEVGPVEEPNPDRPSLVICRRGEESIWRIAKRYGSTVAEIERVNNMDKQINAEAMLLIPVS